MTLLVTGGAGFIGSNFVLDWIATTGEPVAGAHVAIHAVDWRQPDGEATSAEDGGFQVERLAAGRYELEVRAAHGYGTSPGSIALAIAEHADGIVIPLRPALQVVGRVLISPTNQPCEDGSAALSDPEHARELSGSSGADGTVRFDGVLPGTYDLTVTCTGFLASEPSAPITISQCTRETIFSPGRRTSHSVPRPTRSRVPVASSRSPDGTRTTETTTAGSRATGSSTTGSGGSNVEMGTVASSGPVDAGPVAAARSISTVNFGPSSPRPSVWPDASSSAAPT